MTLPLWYFILEGYLIKVQARWVSTGVVYTVELAKHHGETAFTPSIAIFGSSSCLTIPEAWDDFVNIYCNFVTY